MIFRTINSNISEKIIREGSRGMFQVIAVDDEQNALNRFERLISQDSRLKLLSTFTKPTEAAEFVKNNQVDIAFLDIEMPGMTGLECPGTAE